MTKTKTKLLPAKKVQNKDTRLIYHRFKEKFPDLPDQIEKVVYQYLPGAIRLRIVDERFTGLTYTQRQDIVYDVMDTLPARVRDCILLLILMTPKEFARPQHGMELEFDNPTGEHM